MIDSSVTRDFMSQKFIDKKNLFVKKNRLIWIISNQQKDIFKKSDQKNKIITNCFSTSSWKIYFWCRTNDHLRRRIKHVLIEKAQSHNRLKTRIFEIRAMWLRYHNSIYASTAIDDRWEVESRFNRKTRIYNFE